MHRLIALMALAISLFPIAGHLVAQDVSIFDEPLVPEDATGQGDLGTETTVSPMEAAQQKLQEAEGLMQQGNWVGALDLFNDLLTQARIPRAYLGQGICYARTGSNELAINALSSAIVTPGAAQDPGVVELAYIERGKLYMEISRYREAVDDFLQAKSAAPTNAEANLMHGKALLRLTITSSPVGGMDQAGQANMLEAVKSLQKAVELDSNYGEAYLERGRVLYRLGQLDYAIEDLEQAARLMGTNTEASADLGMTYALRASQETYRTDADSNKITTDLRRGIQSMNDFLASATLGEKTAPWETVDPLTQRPEGVLLGRADAQITLANEVPESERAELYQQAIADADRLLALDSPGERDESRAHLIRGVALRMQGKLPEAIIEFTRAIQIYTELGASNSDALLRRGICYYYQGDMGRALLDFEAAATNPNNPYGYEPRAMFWAGVVQAEEGDFQAAVRSYTRSVASAPNYVPALLNRGLAYLKLGRIDQAAEDFRVVLRQHPGHQLAQEYLEAATVAAGS